MIPTILTASGRYFNILEPELTPVSIDDIAHALSHLCRFTGHVHRFYSVAQHSVSVSHLVPPEHALAGLMHDAAEAFIGDVSSPLKAQLPEYKAIERRVEAAIFRQFGLPEKLDPCVKHADLVMLATEKRDMMPQCVNRGEWDVLNGVQPSYERINPTGARTAYNRFLMRFMDLAGKSR